MKISTDPREGCTILHLKGEFDTIHCPALIQEIESLITSGVNRAVLSLRLTKSINSTGLGAIIKSLKLLRADGGGLAISRPSVACRSAIEGVGLNSLIPVFDDEDAAVMHLVEAQSAPPVDDAKVFEQDQGNLLFSPVDESLTGQFITQPGKGPASPIHGHKFGSHWRGVAKMVSLDTERMSFKWDGGNTGLSPATICEMLAPGVDLKVKFRLPLLTTGLHEAVVSVQDAVEREGDARITATYKTLAQETTRAVQQYTEDMAFLKKELREVTED